MAAHVGRLDAPALLGVGAAFDIHAGTLAQAPPGCNAPASSGSSGWVANRAGSGGATSATTRASWSRSSADRRSSSERSISDSSREGAPLRRGLGQVQGRLAAVERLGES